MKSKRWIAALQPLIPARRVPCIGIAVDRGQAGATRRDLGENLVACRSQEETYDAPGITKEQLDKVKAKY
jgi:hypothetical protein